MKGVSHKAAHIKWVHLYEMSRIGKSIKTESRSMVSKAWERWSCAVNAKGHGISFQGDENVLKLKVVLDPQVCEYNENN